MWYVVVFFLIVADQVSKWFMSDLLQECVPGFCRSIELLPVFKLTLLHNEGAAFSFLSDAGGWQRWFLIAVASIMSTVLGVWLYRVRHDHVVLALALTFILGGAVGNLIDRIVLGYVVDFIVVHYDNWYFPAFNLADSCITVGGALLILDMILKPNEDRQGAGQVLTAGDLIGDNSDCNFTG